MQPGDLIAERFRVEALLGEGGIARVYKVRHVRLGSVHALKQLTLVRPALADRLLLEGRIQAQLTHPNLVRVTDVVEHQGQPCLVMEYVAGTHLQALLHDDGPMALDEALRLFTGVLSAVAAAHDLGVLHRDLKPANILLSRNGERWMPKVSDFGIAKIASGGLREGETKAGVQLGTPGYMAPEQIEDSAQVDHRADIFALGAILYEILSGQRPFQEDTTFRTLRATIEGRLVPLQQRVPTCPRAVADAVHRCLQVEMEDRFQDCHALADALLAGRPELRGRVRRADPQAASEALHRPEAASAAPPTPAALQGSHETLSPVDEPTPPVGRPAAGLAPVNLVGSIAPAADGRAGGPGPSLVGRLSPAAAAGAAPAGPRLAMGDADEVTETVGRGPVGTLGADEDLDPARPRRGGPGALRWALLALGAAGLAGLAISLLRSGEEPVAPPPDLPVDALPGDAPPPTPAAPDDAAPSTAATPASPSPAPAATPASPSPAPVATPASPSPAPVATPASPSTAPGTPVAVEIGEPAANPTDPEPAAQPAPAPVVEEVVAEQVVAERIPPEEEEPAPTPPPAPPALLGSWSGSANDKPLTIRVTSQDGESLSGKLTFTQGADERVSDFTGTVSAESNRVVLVEQGGAGLTFSGVVRGTGMMGTYGRSGKDPALSWSARKQ